MSSKGFEHTMPAILDVTRMTLKEKLRALEALWEDLSRRERDIPVPQWHKDLLDERERQVKAGKAKFLDWETAKTRIAREIS